MAQKKPKAPVMVIGGGISGIQASLSLSSAGHGVHLIEKSASLGGMMPNLHRIYPLCACCKLDPRISACRQDPNIDVRLDTTVRDISGKLGAFTVSLKSGGEDVTLSAGAILLATGIETFQPTAYEVYSYGKLPNVITSVEYELLQKPLGPEKGIIRRPSDGKTPGKIAWLQCVGSRDINHCDAPYCSSVCCMHALKEAVNTLDVAGDVETTIFFMDMRAHGKGFEAYLDRALERGVRLIRTRVHTVEAASGGDDLIIRYADESGVPREQIFDMVVLSVGLRPSSDVAQLAKKAGVALNPEGFVTTEAFRPAATNIPGIFACGGTTGPNDIGQSILQASAAVSEICAAVAPSPLAAPVAYPPPSKESDKRPKVLVAYHLCPNSDPALGRELETQARKVPGVEAVAPMDGDIQDTLTAAVKRTAANRVVFASCTPVVHKGLVEEALKRAGLNPYVYELVDLRALDPATASTQLGDRLRMGVARASLITPPPLKNVPVTKAALVVGGGVAGLESALAIARQGYPVTLVEQEDTLGGHARHVRATWQGLDAQAHLKALIDSAMKNKTVTVMTGARLKACRGHAGRFTTTLEQGGKDREIEHGAVILAPGGEPVPPREYLYGEHPGVYTWAELSRKMMEEPAAVQGAGAAVFIQCVGSREPLRPYCSNFCCSFAVRTAIDLKTRNPGMDIYVLYREMRTYGERELLYREARKLGVVFIRYDVENKPVVRTGEGGNGLVVKVQEPILGRPVEIKADFISLQTAIEPANNSALAKIFKLDLDSDGFFAESPEKLRPSDSMQTGVFLAGMGVYPKDTEGSVTQAQAAAARAVDVLHQDTVQVGGLVAEVMPEKCAVCCTCVRTCPFSVPYISNEAGAAYIDPSLCRGCGMCVAECPGKAIHMATCSDDMLKRAPSVLMGA